jgi:hypothetical protein
MVGGGLSAGQSKLVWESSYAKERQQCVGYAPTPVQAQLKNVQVSQKRGVRWNSSAVYEGIPSQLLW